MFTIHKSFTFMSVVLLGAALGTTALNAACPLFGPCNDGCQPAGRFWGRPVQPPYDRPFPLGQVSDAFHESQQANAEAADFILYNYEFVNTRKGNKEQTFPSNSNEENQERIAIELTPLGKNHMVQIVRRLPHVPFPIVIEKTDDHILDASRKQAVVSWLKHFYYGDSNTEDFHSLEERVVVAPDFEYQMRADESINSYTSGMNFNGSRSSGQGGW